MGTGESNRRLKRSTLSFGGALAAIAAVAVPEAKAALLVDFQRGTATEAGYAAYAGTDTSSTTPTLTYTVGSTGYAGASMDTGAGITLHVESNAPAATPGNFRFLDRGVNILDNTDRDWVSVESGATDGNPAVHHLDLRITGLQTGPYDYLSEHFETQQFGVFDAQVSTDGGSTFANVVDNLPYAVRALSQASFSFNAVAGSDVIVRYKAGGGLFGNNGVNQVGTTANRLIPLNAITLVPEPGSLGWLGLSTLALLTGRRRRP